MLNKIILYSVIIIILTSAPITTYADMFSPNSTYEVCFSPNGGCADKIIDNISKAKRQILVQAYSFTSAPIAKALAEARQRGVYIGIILDKGQINAKHSAITFFKNNNIIVNIDYKPSIAHNKIIIIDSETVITGSFNFTKAAEKNNTENVIIIKDDNLAKKYIANYNNRLIISAKSL